MSRLVYKQNLCAGPDSSGGYGEHSTTESTNNKRRLSFSLTCKQQLQLQQQQLQLQQNDQGGNLGHTNPATAGSTGSNGTTSNRFNAYSPSDTSNGRLLTDNRTEQNRMFNARNYRLLLLLQRVKENTATTTTTTDTTTQHQQQQQLKQQQ